MTDDLTSIKISSADLMKLIKQGVALHCRVCSERLQTVPENWKPGMIFSGIVCPKDQKHFMIHCDDAAAMKAIRARMKARSENERGA